MRRRHRSKSSLPPKTHAFVIIVSACLLTGYSNASLAAAREAAVYQGYGSMSVASDAENACKSNPLLISCLNYQITWPGNVTGDYVYASACGAIDPWGDTESGLDDDGYRQAWAGTDNNGTPAYTPDDTYYCYFYDDENQSPPQCPAGYVRAGGSCLKTGALDPRQSLAGGACPASGASPQFDLLKSNPINIGTGNKFQVETDIEGSGTLPLVFSRAYNSIDGLWRTSYSRRLDVMKNSGVPVLVDAVRDNGLSFQFNDDAAGAWFTWDHARLTLTRQSGPDQWTLTDGNDNVETYDGDGKLQSITNRAGQTITFSYDGAGRLILATHFSGRTLQLAYDGSGRLAALTDAAGHVTEYAYDASGRLAEVRYPDTTPTDPNDNPRRTYHYEDANLPFALTGITDENGVRYATWSYDADGRAIASEHAGGADALAVTYNGDGTVTTTDALGRATTYTFALIGGQQHITGVDGAPSTLCGATFDSATYDARGYLASTTDPNEHVTTYVHDARGLLESKTEATGTTVERTVTTTWDPIRHLPTARVEPGRTTTYVYDAAGRLASETVTDTQTQTVPYGTQGLSRVTTYTYNALGLVASIDGPRTDLSDVTTFAYDASGDLVSTTNALGQVTEVLLRDARGLPTRIEDANGLITELTYDPRGRLTGRVVLSSQGNASTAYAYDDIGQLVRVTLPDGSSLHYAYDDARRLSAVEDDIGQRLEYTVDPMGNRTLERVRDGAGTLVRSVSRVFDELSRLHSLTSGVGQTTLYDYDAAGNLTATTDPANRTTEQAFDPLDRLSSVTDPLDGETSYQYDARDNLVQVVDPRGVSTSYVYDGQDRRIQEASADAGTTVTQYDAAGNVTSTTDARGVVAEYTYDALNRVTQTSYPSDSSQNVTYTYDQGSHGLGRLSSITDGSGSTSYAYDDRGNVVTETRVIDGTTYATQYAYDVADRLIAMTYPSGRVVDYSRDVLGRIDGVSQTVGSVTSALLNHADYQPFGGVRLLESGNGAFNVLSVDPAGRVTERLLTDDDTLPATNIRPQAFADAATTAAGAAVEVPILANDVDPDGGTLGVASYTQGAYGTVALAGGGLSYAPNPGVLNATDTFTYRASDGSLTSNVATVTVTIAPPAFTDADADGMADDWEIDHGFDPANPADAAEDPDGDGLTNLAEFNQGSDPLVNPEGYAAAVLAAAPVGYWRLDDAGSTVADATTGAHNGTYYGTYSQSQSSLAQDGSAVAFTNGRVQVPHFTALNASGDFAVEFFLRFSGNAAGRAVKRTGSSPGAGPDVWINTSGAGGANKPGTVQFRSASLSTAYWLETTTPGLNDGRWRHYVFLRRGASIEIWINGELEASTTIPSVPAMSGTDALLAMNLSAGSWAVNGSLDELAFYASAPTPGQIRAHFRSQAEDSDADGMPNTFELPEGFDPLDGADAVLDTDGDGASNVDEYDLGTDPWLNPDGYGASILADDPIGYWPLDDATTTAYDASGSGFNGAYNPSYTQLAPGAIDSGASVTFPNSGYINVPHNAALNMAGDYSIELFIRWSTTGLRNAFSKRSGTLGPMVYVNYPSTGKVRLTQNGTTSYLVSSASAGMNDNVWRHFVFVRRGTQLEVWIDGVLDNTATASVIAFTHTQPLQIGAGVYKMEGGLDEVAFYPSALSPLDILQHYRQSLEPSQASVRWVPEWRYADGGAGLATPLLLTDRRAEDDVRWLYDPSAQPTLQRLSEVDELDQRYFQSLVSVDPMGIDVGRRTGDAAYVYRRLPSGARTGLIKTSGSLTETWTYGYDAVSNITGITKPAGSEVYGYDTLDRLNGYTLPGQAPVTYGYDALGNRLSETQSGVTIEHTYGTTSNRQLTAAGASIGYDASGNRVSDGNGARTFTYDVRNRLRQVTANGTTVGTYTVNGLGQRVRKVAGSADVDAVYDLSGHLIGDYANGTLLREYVYLDDLPMAQIESSGTVTYLHPDHLGTPRTGTDANAQIVWRWDSDPFGEAAPNEDPDGDMTDVTVNLRFPGQYFDVETGLHYNYFRDYEPGMGRYVQSDPIGLAGGLNTYRYSLQSPLVHSDPTGEAAVGGVLGGLAGDLMSPDPSDAAWPKWLGWGVAIAGAYVYDMCIESSGEDTECDPPEGTMCYEFNSGHSHKDLDPHYHVWQMNKAPTGCYWNKKRERQWTFASPPPGMQPCSTYASWVRR